VQAIADANQYDPATVRRILDAVDLQPHRTRYRRTDRLDDPFKDRAEKVLGCSANADRLARRGVFVACAAECPTSRCWSGRRSAGPSRLGRVAGVHVDDWLPGILCSPGL
jgi:hypothetical protein